MVMSAFTPKADMCGAARDVRFGPIADINSASSQALIDKPATTHPVAADVYIVRFQSSYISTVVSPKNAITSIE